MKRKKLNEAFKAYSHTVYVKNNKYETENHV